MSKVPVSATAVAAFRFSLRNYVRLLGILWAPAFVVGGLYALMMVPAFWSWSGHGTLMFVGPLIQILVIDLIQLAMMVVMAVGVTSFALGGEQRWPSFYFSFGRPFWRLLAGTLILLVLYIVVLLFLPRFLRWIIALLVEASAGSEPSMEVNAIEASWLLVLAIQYCVSVWIVIRLGFLLPSIAVGEGRVGLLRNWQLTRRNFWRLLALIVLLELPVLAFGLLQLEALNLLSGGLLDPALLWGNILAKLSWIFSAWSTYARYWYLFIAFNFAVSPIVYGALFAGSAFAYRELAGDGELVQA